MKLVEQFHKLVMRLRHRRRFAVEYALLAGRHRAAAGHRSIIHFTLNRAGSQVVKWLLRRCSEQNGLIHVDMNALAYTSRFPYLYEINRDVFRKYEHVFRPHGYLYSAFNGFLPGIPELQHYLVLLIVRDPRDVLTSRYYSDGFSHGRPPETGDKHVGFDELRAAVRAAGIDRYVLEISHEYKQRYQQYIEHLLGRENVCVLKYEDMIYDYEGFLDRLLEFCNLTITPELRAILLSENANATPHDENIYSHVRKRVPGDYRQKLAPETIDLLNSEWRTVLRAFNYSTERSE